MAVVSMIGVSMVVRVQIAVAGVVRSGPFGPSDVDPDDIRDVACDVTAPDSQCRPPTTQAPQEPDLNSGGNPGAGGAAFGQLLVVALVVMLVVAIVWLAMRYFGDPRANRNDKDDGADAGDLDESIDEAVDARVVDHETPPDRWRRRAAEHRERGEFRDSVRCEYRALVGDLARAGHVDEIPGRTSGEEREQIAELAPRLGEPGRDVARQFDLAADIFDEAWFDNAPVLAEADVRFAASSAAVLDVVLAGSGVRRLGGRRS